MKLWITGTGNFPTSNEYVIITNEEDYRNLVIQALPQMPDEWDIVREVVFADEKAGEWQGKLEVEEMVRIELKSASNVINVIDYCNDIKHLYE